MAGSGNERKLNLTLNVWRQKNRSSSGRFETYEARDISTDMSRGDLRPVRGRHQR